MSLSVTVDFSFGTKELVRRQAGSYEMGHLASQQPVEARIPPGVPKVCTTSATA